MTDVCAQANAYAANMGIRQGTLAANTERSSLVGSINVLFCHG